MQWPITRNGWIRHPAPGSTWDGRYLICLCTRGSAGHAKIKGRPGWWIAR